MDKINLQELIDTSPLNSFHVTMFCWCFIVVTLDGYDLAVPGIALPSIMLDLKVNASTAGLMTSAALFGMAFGAVALGAVADRIGRRKVFAISIFLFSAFTLAAGLAREPMTFSVMRFLAGVGIGGALPNAVAQMTEFAPRRRRGLLVSLMMCGYTTGSVLAALLGRQCLEVYGWRSVFLAAGIPLLLIPIVMACVPESLAYLVKNNNRAGLHRILQQILPDREVPFDAQFTVHMQERTYRASFMRLFEDGRGVSTILLWIAFFTGLFVVYSISTWLVTLLTRTGHSLGAALTLLLFYNLGVIVGTALGGWLGDRSSLKWVLAFCYALGAVSLTALAYSSNDATLFVLIAIVGASTLGTQNLCYAYAGQFYPLVARSTGLGVAAGVGRVGAIAAPILLGALVNLNMPAADCFIVVAVAAALGAIAVAGVNHRRCASVLQGDPGPRFEIERVHVPVPPTDFQ